MAQIGQFTRTQSGYSGRVRTLSLDLAIVFVPVDDNGTIVLGKLLDRWPVERVGEREAA